MPIHYQPCIHGGGFFDAIGETFETLDHRHDIINADVLDAWFPPAPQVMEQMEAHLPWLLQTSPPVDCGGLVQTIAAVRTLPSKNILTGAGSSSLIYLALCHWLTPQSRVLLPDPTYGEYAHVLQNVIGCQVEYLPLSRANGYAISPEELLAEVDRIPYDLVILVNPNNPTGSLLDASVLENTLSKIPRKTRVWVDEAYIDYLGLKASIEQYAAKSENVVVCKSLSKGFALSGARAAYLCGPAALLHELARRTPPWAVSLPAQVAAVAALHSPGYYAARYAETHQLRTEFAADLTKCMPDMKIQQSPANWLLCFLPVDGPDAAAVCAHCRLQNIFLRDASTISPRLGRHTLRIGVKDAESNGRVVQALKRQLISDPIPV